MQVSDTDIWQLWAETECFTDYFAGMYITSKYLNPVYMCVCVWALMYLHLVDPLQIQEEMEMWKMRDWETQMSHNKHLSDTKCVRQEQ